MSTSCLVSFSIEVSELVFSALKNGITGIIVFHMLHKNRNFLKAFFAPWQAPIGGFREDVGALLT